MAPGSCGLRHPTLLRLVQLVWASACALRSKLIVVPDATLPAKRDACLVLAFLPVWFYLGRRSVVCKLRGLGLGTA